MTSARLLVAALIAIVPCGLAAAGETKGNPASEKPHGPPVAQHRFALGADISWVQQQEDEGIRFS
ncbi:MAG: hypothetical protein ABSG53_03990, partial [Thermoguttaceae bacterium]